VSDVVIRPANGESDVAFLRRMLCWAADWKSTELDESQLLRPKVSRYVEGWGRPGDHAVVAEASGDLIGAAWYRLFASNEHGYGFVDEQTPEISIAVEPAYRGLGIGRNLLDSLAESARTAGHPALSLSVEEDNPALRLYERAGYERRAKVGDAWTLVRSLA
jgi:ribosomal protein S18 acetylase RimI-like enzyme